ncbi:MAG: hypothetical protein IJU34_06830 [Bacteroidales bacterium]|nr:hypothetical protein [Bacteroidales bacterium]
MKTVYSNTQRPKLVKWACIGVGILGVVSLVLYVIFSQESYLFSLFTNLVLGSVFFADLKLATVTFDEEADTIVDSRQKKYPLHLSGITTVTYFENKKGKFRYLFIHDAGVGFMQIRTSKENADRMTAQILKANPSAEIKHANYI